MARLLLLFVGIVVQMMGTTAWHWSDWWSEDGWNRWLEVWRNNGLIEDVSYYVVPISFLETRHAGKNAYPSDSVSYLNTLTKPEVAWYCNPARFYTLIMIDPDATGNIAGHQFLHWRIDGISQCDLSTGQTIADYIAPSPPPGTGYHRYVYFMFEHKKYTQNMLEDALKSTVRAQFSMDDYIKKNSSPFAGNFVKIKSVVLGDAILPKETSSLPL